jgi:hypothetical protein
MTPKTTKRRRRRSAVAELRAAARRLHKADPVAAGGVPEGCGMPRTAAQAVLAVARQLGSDGKGSGGLGGYLRGIACDQPKAFTALLGKVLPLEIEDGTREMYTNIADIRARLIELGVPRQRHIEMVESFLRELKRSEPRDDDPSEEAEPPQQDSDSDEI